MTDADQTQTLESGQPSTAKFMFYERLFMKAYDFEITKSDDEARPWASKRIVKDDDIDLAYRTLIEFRNALQICQDQFARQGNEHRNAADGMQTMVERQRETMQAEKFEGIARSIKMIIGPEPDLRSAWYIIESAPLDKTVRLLGKKLNGAPYIETGFWVAEDGRWSIEADMTRGRPTHWTPMEERLPAGY